MKERPGEAMRSCISEKEFNLFLEGSLSPEELLALESHARDCKACSQEYEKWKALKDMMTRTVEAEVPNRLKDRVMDKVKTTSILPAVQPLGWKRKITAALLFLLAACYYFLPPVRPYADLILRETVSYLSQVGYTLLSFAGLDIKTVIAFLKALSALAGNFYMFFAFSTLMLVAAFFALLLKGRTRPGSN